MKNIKFSILPIIAFGIGFSQINETKTKSRIHGFSILIICFEIEFIINKRIELKRLEFNGI